MASSGLIADADPLGRITLVALNMAAPLELTPAWTGPLVVDEIIAPAAAHGIATVGSRTRPIATTARGTWEQSGFAIMLNFHGCSCIGNQVK